jgi:hypothetical protein
MLREAVPYVGNATQYFTLNAAQCGKYATLRQNRDGAAVSPFAPRARATASTPLSYPWGLQ